MPPNRRDFIRNDAALDVAHLQEQRFTDLSIKLLCDASQRAGMRGITGTIPPAILLWAMLRWEKRIPLFALERCGIDLKLLESDTESVLIDAAEDIFPFMDFAEVADVVHAARKVATSRGQLYVSEEELLLGLVEVDDAVRRLLNNFNVNRSILESAIDGFIEEWRQTVRGLE